MRALDRLFVPRTLVVLREEKQRVQQELGLAAYIPLSSKLCEANYQFAARLERARKSRIHFLDSSGVEF